MTRGLAGGDHLANRFGARRRILDALGEELCVGIDLGLAPLPHQFGKIGADVAIPPSSASCLAKLAKSSLREMLLVTVFTFRQ